ncbi:hypothetical protein J7400_00250 [Shimia sp. R9_2]|uniref:hypothetical protein n=1 Tax=Shimia sp. R9_2 TaxID=2821112 RepID=UPI001ADA25C4|nr:hypothetical protein [Shimia sp. R9_2]MBO9395090.1 hypothetical protein [Shimia sp. R9_2]
MQQQQAQAIQVPEPSPRYQPNEAFLQVIEKLEKEVNSKDEYVRRQLEAVFQPR